MIQHLTDDQIARWMLAQRSAAESSHVTECGACARELQAFRAGMEQFAATLHGEAERRSAWRELTIAAMNRPVAASRGLFSSGEQLDVASHSGRYSRVFSLGLHVLAVVMLLLPLTVPEFPPPAQTSVVLLTPPTLSLPAVPRTRLNDGGGGGGGTRTLTPPSRGIPPRFADQQIVPPMVEPKNLMPELMVESTVVVPQLSQLNPLTFSRIGDPNGVVGPPSAGPGTGGGIGTGVGRGVGDGRGPGVGPGEGGGMGGNALQIGGGVTEPRLLRRVNPDYSDAGRKARVQGTVQVLIIVREDGTCEVVDIQQRLGYGLDEKAVEAIRSWAFEPGRKDGVPVPVYVQVLVNFKLR